VIREIGYNAQLPAVKAKQQTRDGKGMRVENEDDKRLKRE
jgi:hypothetical protein